MRTSLSLVRTGDGVVEAAKSTPGNVIETESEWFRLTIERRASVRPSLGRS